MNSIKLSSDWKVTKLKAFLIYKQALSRFHLSPRRPLPNWSPLADSYQIMPIFTKSSTLLKKQARLTPVWVWLRPPHQSTFRSSFIRPVLNQSSHLIRWQPWGGKGLQTLVELAWSSSNLMTTLSPTMYHIQKFRGYMTGNCNQIRQFSIWIQSLASNRPLLFAT